jgi:hypothetical protein
MLRSVLLEQRRLAIETVPDTICWPLRLAMTLWLVIVFGVFGLTAPRNTVVYATIALWPSVPLRQSSSSSTSIGPSRACFEYRANRRMRRSAGSTRLEAGVLTNEDLSKSAFLTCEVLNVFDLSPFPARGELPI